MTITLQSTESGSLVLIRLTFITWSEYLNKKQLSLEAEAEEYRKKKIGRPIKNKPLTARLYLAGQALAGLLAANQGRVRVEEIKHEAFEWADKMLED